MPALRVHDPGRGEAASPFDGQVSPLALHSSALHWLNTHKHTPTHTLSRAQRVQSRLLCWACTHTHTLCLTFFPPAFCPSLCLLRRFTVDTQLRSARSVAAFIQQCHDTPDFYLLFLFNLPSATKVSVFTPPSLCPPLAPSLSVHLLIFLLVSLYPNL